MWLRLFTKTHFFPANIVPLLVRARKLVPNDAVRFICKASGKSPKLSNVCTWQINGNSNMESRCYRMKSAIIEAGRNESNPKFSLPPKQCLCSFRFHIGWWHSINILAKMSHSNVMSLFGMIFKNRLIKSRWHNTVYRFSHMCCSLTVSLFAHK